MRKLKESEYVGWRVKKRYSLHEIAALCIDVSPMDIWSSARRTKVKITTVSGSMEAIIQTLIEDIKKGAIEWSSVNLIDGFGKGIDKERLRDLSTIMTKRDIEFDTFYNQGLNDDQKLKAVNPILSTIEKRAVLNWCTKERISPPVFKEEIKLYEKLPEEKVNLRESTIHKHRCRALAEYLWSLDENRTIEDLRQDDVIKKIGCEDVKPIYQPNTIRSWINDLCPDRSPGRRKKK